MRRLLRTVLTARKERLLQDNNCWQSYRKTELLRTNLLSPMLEWTFVGPIEGKQGRIRKKWYGCLFTCLRIRAIHGEDGSVRQILKALSKERVVNDKVLSTVMTK